MDYSRYMMKDLYLLIYATVQEKNADKKYQFKNDTGDKTPELKIQKIEILNDIRDKLVENLTLTMPLDHIDEEFATDLTDMVLRKKGTVNIYFNVYDQLTQSKIKLFARQYRVKVDKEFYRMLKRHRDNGKLDFQVNNA
jgi:DNA polymerase-3 subunit alpha